MYAVALTPQTQSDDAKLSTALARLLAEDPTAIRQVHAAYFAAGAEVATTASYQASMDGLAAHGLDARSMLQRSVGLATQARDDHGRGWVAASIGPYGAALAETFREDAHEAEVRGYATLVEDLRKPAGAGATA